jgi:hypothetical protein
VWGVTRSTKFPDKGSFGESSKPAGRSASEPISSLVITKKELPTLWTLGEGWDTGLNENCQERTGGLPG